MHDWWQMALQAAQYALGVALRVLLMLWGSLLRGLSRATAAEGLLKDLNSFCRRARFGSAIDGPADVVFDALAVGSFTALLSLLTCAGSCRGLALLLVPVRSVV